MRILFSAWGSAGDLFPLVPVAQAAEAAGHEVRYAVPRTLALYLRALGIRSLAVGSGSEVAVARDPRAFSDRFFGWASWRTLWCQYIAHDLPGATIAIERSFERWAPDVVVTTTFATAARLAAARQSIPCVRTSIYPQHRRLVTNSTRMFASDYIYALSAVVGPKLVDEIGLDSLAWGVDSDTIWLHDRALLGVDELGSDISPVGFPYWDSAVESSGAVADARDFLSADRRKPALVTLGSFVGIQRHALIESTVEAILDGGDRCLVVGAPSTVSDAYSGSRRSVCFIGFAPLSQIIPDCGYVVHHGGIGTTFATLIAGKPAIVMPQAYDQFFNATLIDRWGAGIDQMRVGLDTALTELRSRTILEDRAQSLAKELRTPQQAAKVVLDRITK